MSNLRRISRRYCLPLEEINIIINDLIFITKTENKLIPRNDEVFAIHEVFARLVAYFDILAEDAKVRILTSR
ncbi:hypothetical protein VCRA2123O444_140095 [Vibrio crassostreae]|nr:hypothetical protein VCRA2113O411_100074 [Vibrio crassostreae]CAK1699275.1 hypothetical protein VCRA2118O429_100073 [Vibrio crassostreae]CAK1699422.1 hypothetical protein VCRA2113O412_100074 [Vibrio crassostreae]CAK1699651.1 hypothetical protein VCRA2114O421_100074 [Vibrio crassostreae]CAK1702895.1 hypothetical protein VCRA2113O414_100109 [Vibrio crassostreae]